MSKTFKAQASLMNTKVARINKTDCRLFQIQGMPNTFAHIEDYNHRMANALWILTDDNKEGLLLSFVSPPALDARIKDKTMTADNVKKHLRVISESDSDRQMPYGKVLATRILSNI